MEPLDPRGYGLAWLEQVAAPPEALNGAYGDSASHGRRLKRESIFPIPPEGYPLLFKGLQSAIGADN